MAELLRQSIHFVDLSEVLVSECNAHGATGLVDIIDQVDWGHVPATQASDGIRRRWDKSPERNVAAGNFVFFDPWEWEFITATEPGQRRQAKRIIPDGNPSGFVFVKEDNAEGATEADEPMVDGNEDVSEIDITDGVGASGGAGGLPVRGLITPVASPSVEASCSSADLQVAVVRQFLAGLGVPVLPTVTSLSQLQALASEYLRGGGGGSSHGGYSSGMGGSSPHMG